LSGNDYMASPLFSEREKAVIRWGELVSKNEARYDTETFKMLSKHFDAQEIVELTVVAAFRGLMNRFMDSLQIDLEGPEVQARGGRAVASPEDLHAYLEKIIDLK
jgi:alkylhydroperoxidase family enzyme